MEGCEMKLSSAKARNKMKGFGTDRKGSPGTGVGKKLFRTFLAEKAHGPKKEKKGLLEN